MFYRYGPRTVGDNGGPPVIHHSVAEKIAFGIDRYAPFTCFYDNNTGKAKVTIKRLVAPAP